MAEAKQKFLGEIVSDMQSLASKATQQAYQTNLYLPLSLILVQLDKLVTDINNNPKGE